jgi:hypothetical protein
VERVLSTERVRQPAGRCWHGGTPNLSREVRAMPNVEYMAPWFRSEALIRSMP